MCLRGGDQVGCLGFTGHIGGVEEHAADALLLDHGGIIGVVGSIGECADDELPQFLVQCHVRDIFVGDGIERKWSTRIPVQADTGSPYRLLVATPSSILTAGEVLTILRWYYMRRVPAVPPGS